MRVLMISKDKKIFEEGSAVRARMIKYGSIVEELHIIIVTLKTDHCMEGAIAPNVFVHCTNSSSYYLAPFDAIWKAKHTNAHPDLVTAQDPFECGYAAWRIARQFRVPFELQIHTDFKNKNFRKESGLNRIRSIIAKFTLPQATAIRVVSERVKKSIEGKVKASITILPIFVDIKQISETNPAFSLRAKYPDFTFIILMASRLTPEKDIPTAVRALKKVIGRYPKTGLVIIGEGFKREAIEAEARLQGIPQNVVLPGWQTDLISYYKGASMFLMTSSYEGQGQVLVEAAAANCPIISTDVGIVGSILKDNDSVLVFPFGNDTVLAEKIAAFIGDNDLRRRLVINAREAVTNAFPGTFEEYLQHMKAIWEKIAGGSKQQ